MPNDEPHHLIKQQIDEYNLRHEDKITFIHGGSSIPFSFMGKALIFTDKYGQSISKTIPYALIPTGILRKSYSLYPVVGELGTGTFGLRGRRKEGINYQALSGADPSNKEALKTAVDYSTLGYQSISSDSLYLAMQKTVLTIDENNYLTHLKKIEMLAQNFILMGGKPTQADISNFLSYLENEKVNLLLKEQSESKKENIKKHFNKYSDSILKKLKKQTLPIESDEQLIDSIKNQYPVIYCCSVKADKFGSLPGELKYTGEIGLDSIKLIFVEETRESELKKKLFALGYQDKIEVRPIPPTPKTESQEKFVVPKTIGALKENLEDINVEDQDDYLSECLKKYHDDYFISHDKSYDSIKLISYIIKNYYLINMNKIFSQDHYSLIMLKSHFDNDYLKKAPIPKEQLLQWEKLHFLKILYEVYEKLHDGTLSLLPESGLAGLECIDFDELIHSQSIGLHTSYLKMDFLSSLLIIANHENNEPLKKKVIKVAEQIIESDEAIFFDILEEKDNLNLNQLLKETSFYQEYEEEMELEKLKKTTIDCLDVYRKITSNLPEHSAQAPVNEILKKIEMFEDKTGLVNYLVEMLKGRIQSFSKNSFFKNDKTNFIDYLNKNSDALHYERILLLTIQRIDPENDYLHHLIKDNRGIELGNSAFYERQFKRQTPLKPIDDKTLTETF